MDVEYSGFFDDAVWQNQNVIGSNDNVYNSWLLETGSMTKRLEGYCKELHVSVVFEGFKPHDELVLDKTLLPKDERYWVRDVILSGDGVPWVMGQTIIPSDTLSIMFDDIVNLGKTSLGKFLFSQKSLTREFIHVGCINGLPCRRSVLKIKGKRLMVAEGFYKDSPMCQERFFDERHDRTP